MAIRTIPRESGDTSKGFTLQKLRTTSLMLTHINDGPSIDFFAAVEYGGDVYLDNQRISYVEENKAYESKNFSFASSEIKNTLVYFLDYWLNNNRNASIRFGFYTTNDTAKEINAGVVKDLAIELPEQPILKLLGEKKYDEKNLLSAVKKIILSEYQNQYTGNANFSIEESHYSSLEKFNDEDWIAFLKTVEWKFQQENIVALEAKVIEQIAGIKFPGINTDGRERFIRAELFYELELRQTKTKFEDRFITKDFIELTFRRIATSEINENSFKYLSLNYDEIRQKTKQNLQQLISDKYRAITGNRSQPILLHRKVALYDPSIKISSKRTESNDEAKDYRVEGLFNSFVNSEKPIFLFGELGSGKSTIVANYLLSIMEADPNIVPLFLPSAYLQDKEFNDTESLVAVIKRYINNELPLDDKFFDFDILIKINKETVLIIDGIDELPINRARLLIAMLKKLKESSSHLRIIATGRPLELENVLPLGWHTLSTIPLKDDEIKTIFFQEAIANGIEHSEAQKDTQKRFDVLKNRNELYAIATTPLIICSIWPDLIDTLQTKSLGNILYDVLLRRLSWHEKDQKELDVKKFLEHFPNLYQREKLLGILAREIFYSESKSIPDSTIIKIIASKVPESVVC
ncbi:MAG: NACHT domain-containing protein [Chryseobacterium sp.]|nr:MAG: NACHT domain-containing protein [Chryseobacterium sp.]